MKPTRWQIFSEGTSGIFWQVNDDADLPHKDHLEMSGRKVSVIARYGTDASRHLELAREVIWPLLRLKSDDVRGYLIRTFNRESEPLVSVNGEEWNPGPLSRVFIGGALLLEHDGFHGLSLERTLFPSTTTSEVYEMWRLRNATDEPLDMVVGSPDYHEKQTGIYGEYAVSVAVRDLRLESSQPIERGMTEHSCSLPSHKSLFLTIVYRAEIVDQPIPSPDTWEQKKLRGNLTAAVRGALQLKTPDTTLNRMFDFAKLRATESVFETKMGLVHSPGGGRYYGGIWANDQAEYSGPFFPFLGEKTSNEAALNAYRIYATVMNEDYEFIPSSFEVEGDVPFHAGGDRGDAAMVAYGAARFALARGERSIGEAVWPLVEWCLEYCRRKTNADGVVESDTDELEGRFPTGTANLSTSTLSYGAYRSAAHLARELGRDAIADAYDARADLLRKAINDYFGDTVEGYDTYRYYDGNNTLRAWICLPLVMGIVERKQGTIDALFSPRLWTTDGLATEAGDKVFWDRSTLYALRGVFAAGDTETALRHLQAYTRRRLLGDHVPYPVEAWPEGGQAHLSAESALYCRIFTEGLFGIEPTGFRSFHCLPRLPVGWNEMSLFNMAAFGGELDICVERDGTEIKLSVARAGSYFFIESRPVNSVFSVKVPIL